MRNSKNPRLYKLNKYFYKNLSPTSRLTSNNPFGNFKVKKDTVVLERSSRPL